MKKGLTSKDVLHSRELYGTNELTPPEREKWWKMLLGKFNDPIIKLLLFATVLSFISGYFNGSMTESLGILFAIFLATFISFINEYKASKEFDILNKISDIEPVKALRDGMVQEIPKNEIVVGDIVFLEQGDEVPADGVILEAMTFSVNESTLNGESVPARKRFMQDEEIAEEGFEGTYPLNRVYRGTTIVEGTGVIEIFSVGDNTEIGKTARQALEITGEVTPLNKQLSRLSKVIGVIGFSVAGLTFLALTVRGLIIGEITTDFTLYNFEILLSFFMIAVTLIVVAVPEGLAMSVTLSLAYSMRRMTASHTLVRKMHACETMGATTVICTDKTGTLTQNRMKVLYCSSNVDSQFAEMIASNSTAHLSLSTVKNQFGEKEFSDEIEVVGNATEGALLLLLRSQGFDYRDYRVPENMIDRLPFSTERKIMASLIESKFVPDEHKNDYCLYIKGAPEIILEMCNISQQSDRERIVAEIKELQKKGMRILAFAKSYVPISKYGTKRKNELAEIIKKADIEYVGMVAIADPIRDDVPAAMASCLKAGIEVKIVTGDNSLTAKEIARQSGLWRAKDGDDYIITGSDFADLSDDDAYLVAQKIKVMSRARPADKMRLVMLLQRAGNVVAVTGDGTNDAPALNHANVGLAMGSGTSVAKEASDIVLLNDSFASIITAVQWGRSIYLNIQRFIQFQLTINVVALMTAFIGPFIGISFPLTVTQMLWVNLIMDTFAALALATEPSDKAVLKKKPRGINDFIITKKMFSNILIQGGTFMVFVIGLIIFFFKYSEGESGLKLCFTTWVRDLAGLNSHEMSIFFTTFVLMQFWNLFNVRASGTNRSAFSGLLKNKAFILIAILILILQVVIVQYGGEFFRTEPLTFYEWAVIICTTSLILWTGEIVRAIRKKKSK
ncbi:MAG: calcium-translocating P-type ATPase, PMCA-type [Bacteroidales bacterium]|jgi:Ca2+-transporting ATPase